MGKQRASNVAWAGPLDADWIALDAACGAAHNAQALAPHVRQVVGVDITAAVLEVGRRRLESDGIRNVLLQEGDVATLSFVDASFDIVVCRAALHHFENPTRQVSEMARVCRPGGRVVLSDMVPVSPDVRDRFDEIHRWIDPAHDRALLPDEITALAASNVGTVGHGQVGQPMVLSLNAILTEQSDTERVNAVLQAELDGGPLTGFHPTRIEDGFRVEISTMVAHATRDGGTALRA